MSDQYDLVEIAIEVANRVPKIIGGKIYFKFVKRLFDLIAVLATAPIWLLLIGVLSLINKIDCWDAPVFFSQVRTGRNDKRFKMYKFRTMVPNAEEMKNELMHLNELTLPDFKITNDPRITRFGTILRKTSLDELPQLINVMLGDMTLVGPRPTSFNSNTYQIWQTERLDIDPGVTGLWQIIGRAEVMFDERVRMEIVYIKNSSLGLDLYIIINTLISMMKTDGV